MPSSCARVEKLVDKYPNHWDSDTSWVSINTRLAVSVSAVFPFLSDKFDKLFSISVKKISYYLFLLIVLFWMFSGIFYILFLTKYPIYNSSEIWQKGESQNGGNKNTKHAKFSEKRTYFTPWYLCISGIFRQSTPLKEHPLFHNYSPNFRNDLKTSQTMCVNNVYAFTTRWLYIKIKHE